MEAFEKLFQIHESLDNPYSWKNTFKTESVVGDWDDSGEEYEKDILQPVQIIHFKTDEGIQYIWYAKQSRYNDKYWEIAFGIVKKDKGNDSYETSIEKSGSGNAFRVFATVIEITNYFIEYDDNYEIQYLTLSSKGNNRTSLYKKYLIPRIENFEISEEFKKSDDETETHLQRIF